MDVRALCPAAWTADQGWPLHRPDQCRDRTAARSRPTWIRAVERRAGQRQRYHVRVVLRDQRDQHRPIDGRLPDVGAGSELPRSSSPSPSRASGHCARGRPGAAKFSPRTGTFAELQSSEMICWHGGVFRVGDRRAALSPGGNPVRSDGRPLTAPVRRGCPRRAPKSGLPRGRSA